MARCRYCGMEGLIWSDRNGESKVMCLVDPRGGLHSKWCEKERGVN